MLYAGREGSPKRTHHPATGTGDGGLTDFLLDVLESAGSYEAHILQAERDEDPELLAFLRELRRQDLARTVGVVRLLRRPREAAQGDQEKGIGA